MPSPGATAASSSATETPANIRIISARRSATSPNGTKHRMPNAYPNCVATATKPMACAPRPKLCPITSSSGWL
jgi:hypothetical protein